MSKKVNNITISKDYLDRIRNFTAIVPEDEFDYVPKAFRDLPADQQPHFFHRSLTGEESLRFSDTMRGTVEVADGKTNVKVQTGAYTISVVNACLIRWENYYDANGNIIEFENSIKNLPRILLEELRDEMTSKASLTQEEILGLK